MGPIGPVVCDHVQANIVGIGSFVSPNVYRFHCKNTIRVCLQLNKSVVGHLGPLGLLSGPMYRIKLLALVLFLFPMYTDSIAKRIIHICPQLNKPILVGPSGSTVWAPVQDKVAGNGIFVNADVYRFHCKKNYPCMSSAD